MVAWFIIAITTLAVFAFIAVNGVSNVSSATDAVGRVEVSRKLDGAVTALLARAGSPNDTEVSYLLAGIVINGVYTLPAELSALASTPFGQQIVYCPFGGTETGSASTVVSPNTTSYAIQTASKSGRTYVVGGRPAYPGVADNPDLMGWVMAPRTKTSQHPSCNEVRYNPATGKFEAPDAIVRPIIREGGSLEVREALAREITFFVSQSGSGKGLSSGDPASLITALDYYRTRQPSSMTIHMANGTYGLPTGMLSLENQDRGVAGSLTIRGGGSTFIDQQGRGAINVPGALKLENLIFDADTVLATANGNRVEATNVTVGAITITGGAKLVANSVTVNNSSELASILVQNNGELSMFGTNVVGGAHTGYGIALLTGAKAQIQGAVTYRLTSGTGHLQSANMIQSGTSMTLRSAGVYLASPAIDAFTVAGDLTTEASNIQFLTAGTRSGVTALQGGRVDMSNGSFLGASPQYGIVDRFAAHVGGTAFTLKAYQHCWFSDDSVGASMFSQSPSSAPGQTSTVVADTTLPSLSTPATAAEIAAYSQASKINARRAALRAMNTSSWQCAA